MASTGYKDTFARDRLPPQELLPEIVITLPELNYAERMNCVVELLDQAVGEGDGERVAIRWRGGQWTFAQLLERVDSIAHLLIDVLKLETGNRVLLRGSNDPMMAACWLAVVKAGLIAVATMPLLRAKELAKILNKAEIIAALCDQSLAEEMRLAQTEVPILRHILYFNSTDNFSVEHQAERCVRGPFSACDTAADDICLIAFTSGTSGAPKATMHFHRDILTITDCFPRSILHTQRDEVFCGTAPLGFTFGLGGLLLFPMRYRASTVLLGPINPEALLRAIQDFQATTCFTVPTFYRQMAPLVPKFDVGSLRKAISAGEALPLSTAQLWLDSTGIPLIDGIGSTEMLHVFISASANEIRPGSTGKPIPGYRARVIDSEGRPLSSGEVGRLAVQGPTGCRYLADERQKNYVEDGWNITGDAYLVDKDGYFWHKGRTDDMIITSGYNIAGVEVEEALMKHGAVSECCVVGVPDEKRGQVVKAFVVLRPGYEASEGLVGILQEHVKKTIAPYKYPRAITFRTALPRTETGKLQRFRLREST
jgi:2-aminobenzoate-CoA ligase